MSGATPSGGAAGAPDVLSTRTITVAGLRLATRVNTVSRAALARPALVVLPAAGGTLDEYRIILERFVSERRVAALDWPGFGGSSRPAPSDFAYSAVAYAELLDPWLTAVGATRAVLLGSGIGAAAAVRYTLDHTARVAGLALVGPWGFASGSPVRALLRTFGAPWPLALVEPTLTSLALGPANPATRAILAARRAARRMSDHQASLRALAALVRAERQASADLAGQVAAIQVPSLVVRGALDPLVTAADARRAVAALGQGRTLEVILPNAGHLPWLQQPGPFLNAVAGLLETVEQG